ncbi:DUF5018-related domain-containing protein [Capnocytophaga canis]|uniref:DUF5018 domain-containing protein n=1 Tax=Capnocytophaga canis TaxID=1848903 RepID=A0A3A1YFM5_9FLAO|nr:hypothetical protein [Capnocytophaga canis]RIY36089.1 hypothetical protein CKY20_08090 [Capnocytophaga canis]
MRKFIYIILAIIAVSVTSCLKKGLEDLPEFEENDITGINRVEYRFVSEQVSNASGQNVVKFVGLSIKGKPAINNVDKSITFEVTVPKASGVFTDSERAKVSLNNLVVIVNLSTAARISPIEGSPKLGTPGDWSKPNKYIVEAANGNKAEWTIQITTLNK